MTAIERHILAVTFFSHIFYALGAKKNTALELAFVIESVADISQNKRLFTRTEGYFLLAWKHDKQDVTADFPHTLFF